MSNAPTTLGSTAVGYRVLHSRRTGDPNSGPTAYGEFEDDGVFVPIHVAEVMAPGVTKAKVAVDLPSLGAMPWNWREHFSLDDRIRIVSMHVKPADRHVAFEGFITDVDCGWSGRDGNVLVTAAGPEFRLLSDLASMVTGRTMWNADADALVHCSALPCSFNAGGRPNRHKNRDADQAGAWRGGMGVFTADDEWDAPAYWTAADAISYLLCVWRNRRIGLYSAYAWLDGPADPADGDLDEIVQVDCEGMNLWTAVATIADRCGYDVHVRTINDVSGGADQQIRIVRRGGGTQRTVLHQPLGKDGSMPTLDLTETNQFTASIAESVASCVTRPMVLGGRTLEEISIVLLPAWDPARLAIPAGSFIVPAGAEDAYESEEYVRRYCVGGDLFAGFYADVGRLWDANTDGLYSGEPYNRALGKLANWPLMTYAARPPLTGFGANVDGSARQEMTLEYEYDGSWRPIIEGWEAVPGRLGVRLTARNLASILLGNQADPGQNFFAGLVAGTVTRLRLTCTIAGTNRNIAIPARRVSAGTEFDTSAVFDRGVLGQMRKRTGSRFSGTQLLADEADGTGRLQTVADAILVAMEDRAIEADLPVEWPDDAPELTDVITRVAGIEYDLGVNAGGAKRYPRVIGRVLLLGLDAYAMHLTLGTERKARVF